MRKIHTFDEPREDWTPLLVTAKTILTADEDAPRASAMLIAGERIVAVGTADECRDAAGFLGLTAPRELDLGDVTITPGFIDPHTHPLMHGQMRMWVDCGPSQAATIPEIVALLQQRAAETTGDGPIRGYGYEHRNLAEGRHPTRHELDAVATDREVYLMNASGHGGVVNSFTLEKYGVTRDTPNPPGGEFFRDSEGELTGELSDAACNILTGVEGVKIGNHGPNLHLGDSIEDHIEQLRTAQDSFLRGGVTAVGDCQVTRREFDMYLRLADTGDLKIRYNMYFLSHLLDEGLEIGMRGAFGNGYLSFAGFKFYADGTLGGWTAYFPDGYAGDPCRTGMLYHEPAEYSELIRRAHEAGLQTATHAQSPDAIGMVLDAIEAAQDAHPRPDARHRIEHCGLPSSEQIERMAKLGVHPVNQTQHYYNWGEGVVDAIGEAGARFNPLGEFEAEGVPVTLSSDAPVADPLPLQAIQTAVTRTTARGAQLGDANLRISVESAFAAHTIAGARALGREDDLGSITPGKRADFVVLGGNPLEVDPTTIQDIPVLQTWVGGTAQFDSAEQAAAAVSAAAATATATATTTAAATATATSATKEGSASW
ncbi:amidohydrolase [Gulosibacter molinativorax]|uniref:Amidohydrolase n=1 Tax=Gulosibacter molinativorax TaxID=256821 RepID=A0ABT7C873_9MICO|nr:amidohydrolase [Gulosibacter molinativorax]MDJ1371403.1 amidohydrolase [Gulosibacter molinativorax]QUY62901.1 N-substituted formamide deformylase [Gulosibacter molinativorax]